MSDALLQANQAIENGGTVSSAVDKEYQVIEEITGQKITDKGKSLEDSIRDKTKGGERKMAASNLLVAYANSDVSVAVMSGALHSAGVQQVEGTMFDSSANNTLKVARDSANENQRQTSQ